MHSEDSQIINNCVFRHFTFIAHKLHFRRVTPTYPNPPKYLKNWKSPVVNEQYFASKCNTICLKVPFWMHPIHRWYFLSYSQTSINNIPPPDEWTPEWRHHMENMDMSLHLAYLRCALQKVHPSVTDRFSMQYAGIWAFMHISPPSSDRSFIKAERLCRNMIGACQELTGSSNRCVFVV